MKPFLFAALALFLLTPAVASAQELNSTFSFAREPNNAGTIDYVLKPVVEEIHAKLGDNKPYQIVGAVVRVETERAVLLFANAQTEFQLGKQTDKSVVITADSQVIGNLEYELAGATKDESAVIKLEIGNVLITLKNFQDIAGASAVSVKFGAVTYKLDQDNINALRYVAAQIEKDRKTRQ